MSERPIYIAAACNETYARPLAVMLESLAASLGPGRRVVAFVLEGMLSTDLRSKIEHSVRDTPLEINWLAVDRSRIADLATSFRRHEWFTVEVYFRLLLPELLSPEILKIIYLDCDLLINHDLGRLWDIELGDAYVLAIAEADPHAACVSSKHGVQLYRELGLQPDQRMFNSGVLVLNLKAWRERSLARRVFDYCPGGARRVVVGRPRSSQRYDRRRVEGGRPALERHDAPAWRPPRAAGSRSRAARPVHRAFHGRQEAMACRLCPWLLGPVLGAPRPDGMGRMAA